MAILCWILMGILAWFIADRYEKQHGEKLGLPAWGWALLGFAFGFATLIVETIMYIVKHRRSGGYYG